MDKSEIAVHTLIQKAVDAGCAEDAVLLSQAACNVANALSALNYMKMRNASGSVSFGQQGST